ncbi:MAG: hypothetical protein Q8Q40_09690, partial [Methylococcaceae bacterium]|nr:hypothetical protein [Methylococcaceae bacterium]
IAENGDFRLKQVLMRGQNTKNSRDSVADLSLSVYFLFIRAVFRGAQHFNHAKNNTKPPVRFKS